MAMTDDVGEDLDLLRRVFPKWQPENILSYLMKARPKNRVKNAICKYITSHDLQINRNDCETDAKLIHEVFPDIPFADIFTKMTMLGDERNRIRICLRLLLFESGFKPNSSNLDGEIDSQEIRAIENEHRSVVDDLNNTLTALQDIRNKYGQESCQSNKKSSSLINSLVDSDNSFDIVLKCDKVVLSESPGIESDKSKPSTSKSGTENGACNHSEPISTDSSEITSPNPKKARKFSIDLEQLEDFFNNSDWDFSQSLEAVEAAKIKTIQADKINLSGSLSINGELYNMSHLKKDKKIEDKPTKVSRKNNNKTLIDLTGKSRKKITVKPCTITSDEIINLDTQEVNPEVIIEDKRVPEPILEKRKKNIKPVEDNAVERMPGPSNRNNRKSKLPVSNQSASNAKKSKMDEISTMELMDESIDTTGENKDSFDFLDDSEPAENKEQSQSLQMYDVLLDRKKRASILSASNEDIALSESPAEATQDTPEEPLNVDESLYFPLLEIFPEACPNYLKKLCNNKLNIPGEMDHLISDVLDYGDYPKRIKVDEDNEQEITEEDQLEILMQVLPDADPIYLKKKIQDSNGDPECIKEFINEAMETKSYPSLKEHQRKQQLSTQSKQYTTGFNVEKYLEQIPDPESYFKGKISAEFSYEARDYLFLSLKNVFNMLPIRLINSKIQGSQSLTDIFDKLRTVANESSNHMKSRRKTVPIETVLQNIPFLQEVAYNVNQAAIVDWRATRANQLEERREQHRNDGLLQTCCCCYDDTLLPEEVVQCETGCDSCKQCAQRSTEIAFGEGRTDFPCVGGCGQEYTMRTLQDALSKKLFSKVAQKRQLAEVRAAGLEDLEQCPFCDFANIPTAQDRLFRCFNPECMKESCRKCKEPNHIPLRCEEVEKDADVQARVEIENRMTEALLRTCWKCETKFIKSDGCNKMTCPKCGSFSCYVCGNPVKDYKHFNGQGGDRLDLCPLYSDTNKLHEEAVLKAAAEAKKTVDPAALKLDPTADLKQHFDEFNKNNPTMLPPGIPVNNAVYYPYIRQQHLPIINPPLPNYMPNMRHDHIHEDVQFVRHIPRAQHLIHMFPNRAAQAGGAGGAPHGRHHHRHHNDRYHQHQRYNNNRGGPPLAHLFGPPVEMGNQWGLEMPQFIDEANVGPNRHRHHHYGVPPPPPRQPAGPAAGPGNQHQAGPAANRRN